MSTTLEEQIAKAKLEDKKEYARSIRRVLQGEITDELYYKIANPPMFVYRDAVRLLSEILIGYKNDKPVTEKYITKPENFSVFSYLLFLKTVKIEEKPCYFFFKRKVIVPTQ